MTRIKNKQGTHTDESSGTYSVHVRCRNCRYESSHPSQMVKIELGEEIWMHLMNIKCPHCGCKTLTHV